MRLLARSREATPRMSTSGRESGSPGFLPAYKLAPPHQLYFFSLFSPSNGGVFFFSFHRG
jgi:hypothetical protein